MPGETTRALLAQPEWLRARADRPAAARGRARRLHRLRHLVPRGADRRAGGAGARGGARAAGGRPARLRLARGRDAADVRGRAGLPRRDVARHRQRRARRSPSSPTRSSSCTPGARALVVPHRELHVRGRGDRGAARRGHRRGSRPRSRRRSQLGRAGAGAAKILVAGAGRDWPTAQEAVLKLREGAWVSAGAHQTEQLLHGHLAAVDETTRAYVLEGEGRAAERAREAARALERSAARRRCCRRGIRSSTSSASSC